MNTVSKFENLFNELDKHMDPLEIQTYGISITTMEEVFLKVAQIGDEAI